MCVQIKTGKKEEVTQVKGESDGQTISDNNLERCRKETIHFSYIRNRESRIKVQNEVELKRKE